jgi:hypothetical protein
VDESETGAGYYWRNVGADIEHFLDSVSENRTGSQQFFCFGLFCFDVLDPPSGI